MLCASADTTGVLRKCGGGTRVNTRKKVRVTRDDRAEQLEAERLQQVHIVEDLHGQIKETLETHCLDPSELTRDWMVDDDSARQSLFDAVPDEDVGWLSDALDAGR